MKNKKLIKIIATLLILVTSIGLFSTILVNMFVRFHKCQVSKDYSYDSKTHYHECVRSRYCDKKYSITEHDLVWVVDREEVFETNGIKHRECYCGFKTDLNTPIDNIPYDPNISLEDDIVARRVYNDYWELGSWDDKAVLNIGYFDNSNERNASFSARYKIVTLNKKTDGYVLGNPENFRTDMLDFGFNVYDNYNNKYSIRLVEYTSYSTTPDKALCIYKNDVKFFNLRNEEINSLLDDLWNCSYLDIDFGVVEKDSIGRVFGFRLKTENKEVFYLSNNTGNIKNETELIDSNNVVDTFENILGWVKTTGIYNKGTTALELYANFVGYGNGRFGSMTTCTSGSVWFMNKVNNMVLGINK